MPLVPRKTQQMDPSLQLLEEDAALLLNGTFNAPNETAAPALWQPLTTTSSSSGSEAGGELRFNGTRGEELRFLIAIAFYASGKALCLSGGDAPSLRIRLVAAALPCDRVLAAVHAADQPAMPVPFELKPEQGCACVYTLTAATPLSLRAPSVHLSASDYHLRASPRRCSQQPGGGRRPRR